MSELLLKALLAYLAGSVIGGYWVGRLRGGVDLRTQGSGNVGATNALRTQGKMFALAVLGIDVTKGIVAVAVIPALPWPLGETTFATAAWIPFMCGLAATVGHVFPVWFGFRGGKGAATFAGVFAVLLPYSFLWMLLGFFLAVLFSGVVALGTLAAALVASVHVALSVGLRSPQPENVFVICAAVLVVYTHRENIRRLLGGSESRFDTAKLWRKWRGR